MRCAFLTMDDVAGWAIDADLAFPALERRGWKPEWVRWRSRSVDWDVYDAVYLAAAWDYPEDSEFFLHVLKQAERSGALLVNSLALVRWNLSKRYLCQLESAGVAVVPSHWGVELDREEVAKCFDRFRCEAIIVKPAVSTNARATFLIDRDDLVRRWVDLERALAGSAFLVQPFIASVQTEGEYSMIRIGEEFSHALNKRPRTGDFRVQEEHGADLEPVAVSAELMTAATSALAALPEQPLYARIDLVRGDDAALRLMELELIEPSLYLRLDEGAPERFARAFDRHVRGHRRLLV